MASRAFTEGSCVLKIEPFAAALLPRCRERRCAHLFLASRRDNGRSAAAAVMFYIAAPACQKRLEEPSSEGVRRQARFIRGAE